MHVKYKDIAKIAKVSVATVSLALNNKPGISEATRRKILRIAKSIADKSEKYSVINNIKKGAIRFIKIVKHGHVLNLDHDVFISHYIEGMENEAKANGYNLEVGTFRGGNIHIVADSFNDSTISGFLILGTELNADDIASLTKTNRPVAFIDTYFDYLPYDFVDMNNIEEVFQIVRYFYDRGHRSIGMVRSDVEVKNFELRDIGFQRALKHFDLPYDERSIFTVDSTFDGAYRDMTEHLKKTKTIPSALFVVNDITAYGCIKALREKSIRAPDDVSVIGFDDLPMSALMEPSLTTMKVSNKRIGCNAMRLLIERIEKNGSSPSTKVTIGGELIERDSVRKL